MMPRHWEGIVNWVETRISNGILEGFNSLVQAAKSRPRGHSTTRNYKIMVYLTTGKLDFKPLNPEYNPLSA